MINLTEVHAQDLDGLLAVARLRFTDAWDAIYSQMFRASFGALFCEVGASFGEKLDAYDANKSKVAEVLASVASELDARFGQSMERSA